jgi:hypothetical protein
MGHFERFVAVTPAPCRDVRMGRFVRWLIITAAAIICGVVVLALTLWVTLIVAPDTVLGSCSTTSVQSGPQVCTPESPWAWLPFTVGLLGAAAAGIGTALLLRRRTISPGGARPPVVPVPG